MSLTITINGENRNANITAETSISIQKTLGEPWTCELGTFSLDGEVDGFTGDGAAQQWELSRIPVNIPGVTVGGVAQTVGIYGLDTGKDFYWELGTRNLYQDSGATPVGASVAIGADLGTWYPSVGQTLVIQQTSGVSYQITGDGTTQTFTLPQIPSALLALTYNSSLPQTFGVYGVDTGKQWYIDYATGILYQDPGGTPLTGVDTLDVGYDYLVTVFAGVIRSVKRMKDRADSPALKCSVSATDYNHILERRLAGNREWANTTDNAIVTDLHTDYLVDEGVTLSTGTAVDVASFRAAYDTLAGALGELAKLGQKRFWIDTSKTLRFLAPVVGSAPFDIPSGASNIATLEVTETDEDYCNVVVVRSAQTITDTEPESFTGDGTSTTFELSKPVASAPSITVNGTVQSVGVYGVDTDKDWLWEQGSKQIRQKDGAAELTSSDTLTVSYSAIEQVFFTSENTAEIAARAAKEGGTGRYEKLYELDRLLSRTDAQSAADAILAERSTIPLQASYRTSDYLEPEAKNLQPGQIQAILIDGWASQQNEYLIRDVRIDSIGLPASNDWQFSYTVEAFWGSVTKTLLAWFRELSSGPSSGGSSGAASFVEGEQFHFFLGGCDAVPAGDDVSAFRPVAHRDGQPWLLSSDCKTAPTSELRFNIKYTNDGSTWASIHAGGYAIHPAGQNGPIFITDFADGVGFTKGTKFRCDVTTAGAAAGWALKLTTKGRANTTPGTAIGAATIT